MAKLALYVTSPYDNISSWCRLKCELQRLLAPLLLISIIRLREQTSRITPDAAKDRW